MSLAHRPAREMATRYRYDTVASVPASIRKPDVTITAGEQSREHLLKECRTWKNEIRELWRKVGEISGEGRRRTSKAGPGRRSKGLGFRSQEYRVGPGNCPVRKLLCDPLFTEAVLDFLEKTDVGKIKKGVIIRGEAAV